MSRAIPLDPDLRRAQLLDVARSVLARQGYHATSVADIIAEAGVARGTFYNYFESKRSVFQAVLDSLMEALADAVTLVDPDGDIPGELRANLTRIVNVLTSEHDLGRLLFADAVGLDAEGDTALRAFYTAATGRIAQALRRGIEIGVVAPGDTELTARCLLGLLKEPIFQSWLYQEPLPTERLVNELLRVLVGGVLVR